MEPRARTSCPASAHNNGTPANLADDVIADTSSSGNGSYNPRLASNGEMTRIGDQLEKGTSFAAPLVASTIALMRQVNPNLSSDQIRDILTSTALDTSAAAELEGAGMLDPAAAIRRAFEMR